MKTAIDKHFQWYSDWLTGRAIDVGRRVEPSKGERPPDLRRMAALLAVVAQRFVGEA